MERVKELKEAAQRVLIEAAEKASRPAGFTKRRSKLTGGLFVRTLVFGWLSHPEATLEELCQTAASLGARISPQGLDQRFTQEAADFLKAVLEAAVHEKVRGEAGGSGLIARFRGVYLIDSSQVTLPSDLAEVWRGNGRKNPKEGARTEAAVKIHLGLDLARGTLLGPELTDGKEQDRNADLMATILPRGSLRIADLGYFRLGELARLSAFGVFFVTRYHSKADFYDAEGHLRKPDAFLSKQKTDRLDLPIFLGSDERLPCRLLAVRAPKEVSEERRRKLREKAKARGQTPSERELTLCDWTILVTSAPSEMLSVEETFVLARLRWQIELIFKLWKSQLLLDEWRSKKRWRILCEIYAKLLAALLLHWTLVATDWDIPDRSAFKAAKTIRLFAPLVALALQAKLSWETIFDDLSRCLRCGCRLNKRKKAPSSAQLTFDPLLLGLN
jgi:hypothetical protein